MIYIRILFIIIIIIFHCVVQQIFINIYDRNVFKIDLVFKSLPLFYSNKYTGLILRLKP